MLSIATLCTEAELSDASYVHLIAIIWWNNQPRCCLLRHCVLKQSLAMHLMFISLLLYVGITSPDIVYCDTVY